MCLHGTPQFNEAVGRWKHGNEMMPGKKNINKKINK